MPDTILLNAEEHMEKTIETLKNEFTTIRTGRANPQILDRVTVEYYGAPTPLNQLAGITVPEPRLLQIKPYDKSIIKEIERAINMADLGFNPNSNGDVIRIVIPQLTEERRKELAKSVHKFGEDAKVSVRNIRRHGNDDLKKLNKSSDLTDDDLRGYLEDIQEMTDNYIKKVDELVKQKEADILHI